MANRDDLSASSSTAPVAGTGKWMALLAAFLGWMFDGFEMGLFPLVARPALTDLLGASQKDKVELWFGVMIAGFLVGAATGGVVFGWLGDRIGRVRAMTLSVLAYAVFTGLCGIAQSVEQVFLFRFIASLGMGGEWSLGVALVMEIWPNRSRGVLAGLIGGASNVGFLAIAVIGLGLGKIIGQMETWLHASGLPESWVQSLIGQDHSGWRLLMIIGTLPALLTFFIRLMVPESERWLHEKKQGKTSHWATRDLLAVALGAVGPLTMIYLWVNPFPPAVQIAGTIVGVIVAILGYMYPVLRYLQRARLEDPVGTPDLGRTLRRMLLGACLSGVALFGTWGAVQLAPSWADKLVEARNAEAESSPEVTRQARSYARSLTQICAALGAIIGTMAGALLGNAIGRRPTYTILCLGSLASAYVFFMTNDVVDLRFLVTVFFTGALTAAFYGWLPLYLPELFSTSVRATGQGFSFNFGRILAAVGALQVGPLVTYFKGSYPSACMTICLVYILGAGLIWIAPETRGQALPE